MATWPVDPFPQSLSGSGDYQEGPEKVLVRSQTDAGFTKVRRRQTRAEAPVSGSIEVGSDFVDIFMDFYNNTLLGGSLSFYGTLTRIQTLQLYRFAEDPVIIHMGGDLYKISIKLNVLPT